MNTKPRFFKIILQIFQLTALLFWCSFGKAQKLPIDTNVFRTWPMVSQFGAALSNDGKFAIYYIDNKPQNHQTMVLQSTDHHWQKPFIDIDLAAPVFFTSDNKYLSFTRGDTLFFQHLGDDKCDYVTGISGAKVSNKNQGNLVAYKINAPGDTLIIRNLITKTIVKFPEVEHFLFNKTGSMLLIQCRRSDNNSRTEHIKVINTSNLKAIEIYNSTSANSEDSAYDFAFDDSGEQLSYVVRKGTASEIWYWNDKMAKAEIRASNAADGINGQYQIAGSPEFSNSGKWLFFGVTPLKHSYIASNNEIKVNVWSYKDLTIIPDRQVMEKRQVPLKAVVRTQGGNVDVLENERNELETSPDQITSDFVVLGSNRLIKKVWQKDSIPPFRLFSLKDGKSFRLNKCEIGGHASTFYFSPNGRYLVYYSGKTNQFYSVDLKNYHTFCLTKDIKLLMSNFRTSQWKSQNNRESVSGVVGWRMDGNSILVCDNYDIWELGLDNKSSPKNITNGFGRKNHIAFRLLNGPESPYDSKIPTYVTGGKLVLVAFNTENKYNGFYEITAGSSSPPKKLTIGPYKYYLMESMRHHFIESLGVKPVQAQDSKTWLLRRESLTDAPNYFITHDFRSFERLSNLQPQDKFKWVSDTLISWKLPNGRTCKGILYKPEKLSKGTKYPLIFYYYEHFSDNLFDFLYPDVTTGDINIPWFVTHGFFVFVPDIAIEPKLTGGEAACMTVTSAVASLKKFSAVDVSKIGLQGHSFGAYETNYIISHSNKFAAAAEFAGVSDFISDYLSLTPLFSSIEHYENGMLIEQGHSNFADSPWDKLDTYLNNSAVIHADKITTPLLITHNPKDNQIPYRQGIELYLALRRLNKPVWLLQYENGNHGLSGRDALDFTVRLTQFFNYYLKGASPPYWMTNIGRNYEHASHSEFELDKSGAKP